MGLKEPEWRLMTVTVIVRYDQSREADPDDWRWRDMLDAEVVVLKSWPTEVAEMLEVEDWEPAKEQLDRLAEIAESATVEWGERVWKDAPPDDEDEGG
jgi:hypothetical protein